MQPWTRDQTRIWIRQLEDRLEDIGYYLDYTLAWCEKNDIYHEQIVFACSILTVIWVSHMRGEPLSKKEVLEILGFNDLDEIEDEEYSLNPNFHNMDLDDLLEMVIQNYS
jgi:hypothetical protein